MELFHQPAAGGNRNPKHSKAIMENSNPALVPALSKLPFSHRLQGWSKLLHSTKLPYLAVINSTAVLIP